MIFSNLHQQLFQSRNQKQLKRWRPLIGKIHRLSEQYASFTDADFVSQTQTWRDEFTGIEDLHEVHLALTKRRLEAYALALAATRLLSGRSVPITNSEDRVWDMVYHDVQLMGGLALHDGSIAEMGTGEGKTLVATLPTYLAALAGRGVHVVTVNDYLALRDSTWMGNLFQLLGLTVGCLKHGQSPEQRSHEYQQDIVYGTASEFGFDYLRDHSVAADKEELVQRAPFFALIDEIDSVLIDEARTPLIITGQSQQDNSDSYRAMKPAVERLMRAQSDLCGRFLKDAKIQLAAGEDAEAAMLLYQVQLGMPLHKGLRKTLEDPRVLRLVEQTETALNLDHRRGELIALKDQLYFSVDRKRHTVDLTDSGCRHLCPDDPNAFAMPDWSGAAAAIDGQGGLSASEKRHQKAALHQTLATRASRIHAVNQLLRAYTLHERDTHYQIDQGEVVIVDEHRGRPMPGRRWSDGLHQAVEAKEGVVLQDETVTLATITLQNYFRLYPKLSGMTGTALPEAEEFAEVYDMSVAAIPPHRRCQREDLEDLVFRTKREKYQAVIREIHDAHTRKQPVLVGTASVEASESLSRMLRRKKIPHRLLNAKHHAQEASIIAEAGRPGAVTISTNMAGRGTDIKLGDGVADFGGLFVIGTERHPSRRVDLQLRGRSGRQGDPGRSRFFVSLEDDLFKHFGHPERLTRWMEKISHEDGDSLKHPILSRSLARAQTQLERHHAEMRRHTLRYDDVLQAQRAVVYEQRQDLLTSENARDELIGMISDTIDSRCGDAYLENADSDLAEVLGWVQTHFPVRLIPTDLGKGSIVEQAEILKDAVVRSYEERVAILPEDAVNQHERLLMTRTLDRHWQEHLEWLDGLREAAHLEAVAQRDPLLEYRRRAFEEFQHWHRRIATDVTTTLIRSLPRPQTPTINIVLPSQPAASIVGRNEPCPCGSRKKYKRCCA